MGILNLQRVKRGRYQNCWHSFKADWESSRISELCFIWKIGEELLHAGKHLGYLKNGIGAPSWREEVIDQHGMSWARCSAIKHFFFFYKKSFLAFFFFFFKVCVFCFSYHWGASSCLSSPDGRRGTKVDQMRGYLAQGACCTSRLVPTAVTNAQWQPQKNSPCGVSSGRFLDCIKSDLTRWWWVRECFLNECFLIIAARLPNSKPTNQL